MPGDLLLLAAGAAVPADCRINPAAAAADSTTHTETETEAGAGAGGTEAAGTEAGEAVEIEVDQVLAGCIALIWYGLTDRRLC